MKNRLGLENINKQGMKMVIIEYHNSNNITVKFEDGTIITNKSYYAFNKGSIRNPNLKYSSTKNRTGEIVYNNQNLKMEIIHYFNAENIDVQFEDGCIIKNVQYASFIKGNVNNPNFPNSKCIDRTGEENINNQGLKMKIIKYRKYADIDVKFIDDGSIVKHKSYYNFLKGKIRNTYVPEVYGIGFLGASSSTDDKGNMKISYCKWKNMLERCYNYKNSNNRRTYEDIIVCKEWHDFSKFEKWFDENYYKIDDETMCLDKDILIKGNKIYSPETCLLVPQTINALFVKSNNSRGNLPIGVCKTKEGNYSAECSIQKKKKKLGRYSTPEEAFYIYKEAKEEEIKRVAEVYKPYIPRKLYNALINYKVEITD